MVKTFVPVLKIVLKLVGSVALTINETLNKTGYYPSGLYLENR